MQAWSQIGLCLVVIAQWFSSRVSAENLEELCKESPLVCEALLSEGKRTLMQSYKRNLTCLRKFKK